MLGHARHYAEELCTVFVPFQGIQVRPLEIIFTVYLQTFILFLKCKINRYLSPQRILQSRKVSQYEVLLFLMVRQLNLC